MRHIGNGEAAKVIQRVAFVGGLTTFSFGCWQLLGARPDIGRSIISQPFLMRNIVLVLCLIGIAAAMWPLAGWMARGYLNWRSRS